MAKKLMSWKTKGMNQDLSVSAFNPEFSFENMNLRLSTNESNTMLSWVNERGTKLATLCDDSDNATTIFGTPIGTAVINHRLIIFTCEYTGYENGKVYPDHIYALEFNGGEYDYYVYPIFKGNLNLDSHYPLETLVSYEADNIQKVYWVDGRNQPRFINIAKYLNNQYIGNEKSKIDTLFDFVPTFETGQDIHFEVINNGTGGIFAPGVIQYCFTYFNKFGQQTNIVAVSPLMYIAHANRGASPEEKINTSFKISCSELDGSYDYVRLYSIQRTSLDATPYCRIVADIVMSNNEGVYEFSYIDSGAPGTTIDPQELLYVGGKELIASTIEAKDSALFLGDLEQKYHEDYKIQQNVTNLINNDQINVEFIRKSYETIYGKNDNSYSGTTYSHHQQLKYPSDTITTFKGGETYRLGFQLQRATGEWSDPIWLKDLENPYYPKTELTESSELHKDSISPVWDTYSKLFIKNLSLPVIEATINKNDVLQGISVQYTKIRPVIVYPQIQDRTVICQGILNPTVFNVEDRPTNSPFVQSSWFFRPYINPDMEDPSRAFGNTYASANHGRALRYKHYDSIFSISDYNKIPSADKHWNRKLGIEIQNGENTYASAFPTWVALSNAFTKEKSIIKPEESVDSNTQFFIDQSIVTLHSPDIEFDTDVQNIPLEDLKLRIVGAVPITAYQSSHRIDTSSAKLESNLNVSGVDDHEYGKGEVSNNVQYTNTTVCAGIRLVSDYLWKDAIFTGYTTNDDTGVDKVVTGGINGFLIYPWQVQGSLSGDWRDDGKASSVLKTKRTIHSSYSLFTDYLEKNSFSGFPTGNNEYLADIDIHLWENEYIEMKKLENRTYYPNIDKVLYNTTGYKIATDNIFNIEPDHVYFKPVSLKYKSGTHMILSLPNTLSGQEKYILPAGRYKIGSPGHYVNGTVGAYAAANVSTPSLAFWNEYVKFKQETIDLQNTNIQITDSEGNTTMLNYLWLGELYRDGEEFKTTRFGGSSEDALKKNVWIVAGESEDLVNNTKITWTIGDTYYQRYDCLKTYAYTEEDMNQNTEILSFMCETHVNIDGRYDANRGLMDNFNLRPQIFNVLNPVYSQQNNYFSSRKVMDQDTSTKYPNWINYSLNKKSGADIDEWTHLSMGSIFELDGNKGKVNAIRRLNDQLIVFQDTGISQILYNENVQISSTEGVPIEIANSGKVSGVRYFTNTVGCINKWSICSTPMGLYFMDSNNKNIYLFNGQLADVSTTKGFNTWCKKNITSAVWNPKDFMNFVSYYDPLNQEVLFINSYNALAYSEKLGAFTSFYSYGEIPYFCSIDGKNLWLKRTSISSNTTQLWKHQAGNYCRFFGVNKPYWITLIGNPEPQTDKIFTNMEFRACVDGDGETSIVTDENGNTHERYNPYLPFDKLEAWNEYQGGSLALETKFGRDLTKHHNPNQLWGTLKRKFRIWRCDIPRDGGRKGSVFDYTFDYTFHNQRIGGKDRIRNPWVYLRLGKGAAIDTQEVVNGNTVLVEHSLPRTEIHDMIMTYFN